MELKTYCIARSDWVIRVFEAGRLPNQPCRGVQCFETKYFSRKMFRLQHLSTGMCHPQLPGSQSIEIFAAYWRSLSGPGRLPHPYLRPVRGMCRQLPGRCHSTWKRGFSCKSGCLHWLFDLCGGLSPWCYVWAAGFRCARKMHSLRWMCHNVPARCYYPCRRGK